MSQDRRPSPVQPPIVTNPLDIMAQVQLPPEFTNSNFRGRPGHRYTQEPALPPLRVAQSSSMSTHEDLRLPPILPPPSDWSLQPLSDMSSITNRLSRNPDSPKDRKLQYRPLPHSQGPQPRSQPSMARISNSPDEVRGQLPSYPPVSRHYIDEPPRPPRARPQSFQSQQHSQTHWHYPSASLEPEQSQHSPATSTKSFSRGYFSSSSEPSPRAQAPPAFPTPPRRLVSQTPPFNYNLSIRQQPVAARACGFGERDRRVIDPPPILELKITDRQTGAPEQDLNAMHALHCTLLSHDGKEDETEVPGEGNGMPSTRRLMGTLVASPYQAKDEHGVAGTFFVFPDLSCRSPGRYRLRFKLLRVDPTMMMPGAVHGTVASIVTDIFSVYSAKDFPGMRASSALLKSLRRQGLNVGVKKGSEARKGRSNNKKGSGDEDDDDSDEDVVEVRRGSQASGESDSGVDSSPKKKSRKKGKKRRQEP